MFGKDYFSRIMPRIFAFISDTDTKRVPQVYRRAASFTISRILSQDETFAHQDVASAMLISAIHQPLLHFTPNVLMSTDEREQPSDVESNAIPLLHPSSVISVITTLLSNADPSPSFVDKLLRPIIPSLYSLLESLQKRSAVDPVLKERVSGILTTWLRISSSQDVLAMLWKIIHGERQFWQVDVAGEIRNIERQVAVFSRFCYNV